MRGTTNDQVIYTLENGEFAGVGLGFDFCAEHECGMRELQERFGIPAALQPRGGWGRIVEFKDDLPVGVDKYTVSKGTVYPFELTETITDYSKRPSTKRRQKLYGLTSYAHKEVKDIKHFIHEAGIYHREDINKRVYAAWDEGDFLFMVESKVLRDLILNAFKTNDIIMFLGAPKGWPIGTNFNIFVKSRVPLAAVEHMKNDDLDNRKLMKAFKASNIEERLKAAGCGYYALSPRWQDNEKTEFKCWLNPSDQKNNNSGWYSVKELEEWAEGKGPIPMKAVAK